MTIHPLPRVKLTWPDYLAFPDDGLRHEVIDGEHHVSATPIPYHQLVVGRLFVQLHLGIAEPGLGIVIGAPVTVQLGEHDIVAPDITVLMNDRKHMLTPKKIKGAPSLLIEVLSPATRRRDRGAKQDACARNGVPEYWLVDPDEHAVEQWLLRQDRYALAGTFADTVTPACAPAVAIVLAKVW